MQRATYNYSKFEDCVARGVFLAEKAIKNTNQPAIGYKWAIEQAINNRNSSETMMTAVIRYIDRLEFVLEQAA
jgi:hypothetical protein